MTNYLTYVGRLPCGCMVAAYSFDPTSPEAVHAVKELAKWRQDGLTVEQISDAALVRAQFTSSARCPHKPQQLALFEVAK